LALSWWLHPFWALLRLVDHDSIEQKVLLCALLCLIGVALALILPPLMVEITEVVEAQERECPGHYGKKGAYGQAYGLFMAAWSLGSLIGPIWSGFVANTAGWGTMAWSLGFLSFSAAVPCLFLTGGFVMVKKAETGEKLVATNDASNNV
jgi:MFS family permease